jgi:hypothetical protein
MISSHQFLGNLAIWETLCFGKALDGSQMRLGQIPRTILELERNCKKSGWDIDCQMATLFISGNPVAAVYTPSGTINFENGSSPPIIPNNLGTGMTTW